MKKFLFYLLTVLLLIICFALIYNPERYIEYAKEGILLWALTVLPSLLPFFFLTLLFTNLGLAESLSAKVQPLTTFLYRCSGAGAFVQMMSFISGYPVGAKLIAELYKEGRISSEESTKISLFTSTSGPMFVIGSVGVGMFESKIAGVILLVCHYLSAIISGVIFRNLYSEKEQKTILKRQIYSSNFLYDCAYGSTVSCLIIGTFITVFYVFCKIITDFKLLTPLTFIFTLLFSDEKKALAFCAGLIEFTNGCAPLSKTQGFLTLPLTAFIISFGGLSILIQSIAFLKEAKANLKIFILGKFIQAFISFLLCSLCLLFVKF